jgi:DNA polymerase-1
MARPTLYLLDAYALIFRAYYAFFRNPRINSKGLNTSAMFGFVNALEEVLNNRKPSHIAVCFDHKSPNVRVQEFPYYKANRQETPEDIRIAEPYIRSIIEAYGIPIIEAPGYEADDVIGTLAKRAEQEGYDVYMVTPDKDFRSAGLRAHLHVQTCQARAMARRYGDQKKSAKIMGSKGLSRSSISSVSWAMPWIISQG